MSFGNNYRSSDIGLTALHRALDASEATVDVVLVATPGFPKPKEWAVSRLPENGASIGNANMYAYEAWTFHEDFSWKTLSNHGKSLVRLLATRYNSTGETSSSRPIILMAHSLAGFIVKECLIFLHTQKSAEFRLLRNIIAGAVFMGCPHTSFSETRSNFSKKCFKILELAAGQRERVKNISRLEDCQHLIDICTRFDNMGGSLNILTLYEATETKLAGRLKMSSMVKLVDGDLARVNLNKFETPIEIRSDHRNLPCPGDSTAWSESALGHVRSLIQRAHEMGRQIETLATESGLNGTMSEPLTRDLRTTNPHPKIPAFLVDKSMPRQPNTDFQGSKAILSNLERHLLGGPHVALLHGEGGLGKSETAIEFAHKHEHDFDVVLWVQADDLSKLRQDFGIFAAELGLQSGDSDPFVSRELVKNWLVNPVKADDSGQGTVKATWLAIFDGVDKIETLKEFESIYGRGSILVTSRDPNLFANLSKEQWSLLRHRRVNVRSMNLDKLSATEGAAVLKKLADVDSDEDADDHAAKEIVGLVQGWPLAIRQMAGIIRNNEFTLSEFYEHFKNERREAYPDQSSRSETIISSIRMANLSPNAMALLRVCAMLDPDCIQESLFVMESMVEKVLEDFPLTPHGLERARDELLSAFLVQRNEARRELWMHREVQNAVRGSCNSSLFDEAFRTAAALVRQAWQPVPETVRDKLKLWEPCAVFLRHVLHLQQVYVVNQASKSASKATKEVYPCFSFAWLLHEVGCFQRGLGDTSGIESTLVLALSICEQLPRKKAFHLLCEIYHGLGAWANETNHPHQCLKYNSLYLGIWKEALADGEPMTERTAAAWNQYGTGLAMVRRYREAMDAFQTSINVYKELALDKPCPDSLPVVNFGLVKWIIGDHASAFSMLSAGQQAREEAFGFMDPESFRTGRFFHALGNVCYDQGDLVASEKWHNDAREQYMLSLGPRHHRTADVCHRVAEHCLRNGDVTRAGQLIDEALGSWGMDVASFKPEIARTTWLKARLYRQRGDSAGAAKLHKEAGRLRSELVPGDKRLPKDLIEEDFDDLVAFWSR